MKFIKMEMVVALHTNFMSVCMYRHIHICTIYFLACWWCISKCWDENFTPRNKPQAST